jgi:hypothetical protein
MIATDPDADVAPTSLWTDIPLQIGQTIKLHQFKMNNGPSFRVVDIETNFHLEPPWNGTDEFLCDARQGMTYIYVERIT